MDDWNDSKRDSVLFSDMLTQVLESVQDIKITLAKIQMTQEHHQKSLDSHVTRMSQLEAELKLYKEHVSNEFKGLKKEHADCPARLSTMSNKGMVDKAKDITIVISLLIMLLKIFKVIP